MSSTIVVVVILTLMSSIIPYIVLGKVNHSHNNLGVGIK